MFAAITEMSFEFVSVTPPSLALMMPVIETFSESITDMLDGVLIVGLTIFMLFAMLECTPFTSIAVSRALMMVLLSTTFCEVPETSTPILGVPLTVIEFIVKFCMLMKLSAAPSVVLLMLKLVNEQFALSSNTSD